MRRGAAPYGVGTVLLPGLAVRALSEPKRRAYDRLGFAAQMTTVRLLGVFLDDPTDVPAEVVDYLAEQLGGADASALKAYGERESTRLDHVRELRRLRARTGGPLRPSRRQAGVSHEWLRDSSGSCCDV